MMRHGFPTTTELSGISLATTVPAPMTTRLPIVVLGKTIPPHPMKTSSPIYTFPVLEYQQFFLN